MMMRSAASKVLALLLLVAALAQLQEAEAGFRPRAYRTSPIRIYRGGKYTYAPKVDGCKTYSTYYANRYWSSTKPKYSSCGSRTYRRKYCVDAPVCEECGYGYVWNPESQMCDCAAGYGMIPTSDYVEYKKMGGKQSKYCYPTMTKTGYYADKSAKEYSYGVYPKYVDQLGDCTTQDYWRGLMKRYKYKFRSQGYYKGHFMYKSGYYPVPKTSELCMPCPEGYTTEQGPPGYNWCTPEKPTTCQSDTDCTAPDTCDTTSGTCVPPSCVDVPTVCIRPGSTPSFQACNNSTGTCQAECADDGTADCPAPTVCTNSRCQAPDVADLTDCSQDATACNTDSEVCGTFGSGRYCVPCWLATNNACTGGQSCQPSGACA